MDALMDALMDTLGQGTTSPWLYVMVLVVVAIDAFLPVVPGEPLVIAAGVFAATGSADLLPVVGSAALGAFLGDHIAYHLGQGAGPIARRLRSRGWGASMVARAEHLLRQRGGVLLVTARFLPGGRTATNLAAGALRYPLLRFRVFVAVAAVLWGWYATLLGYWGGSAFGDDPVVGLLVGLGVGFGATAMIQVVRHLRRRRASHVLGGGIR